MRNCSPTLRPWLICSLAIVAFAWVSTVPARGEITVGEIIENVRRNETLYANIDARIHWEYSIGDREPVKFVGVKMEETVSNTIRAHYVIQGELFRLDREGRSSGKTSVNSLDRIRAFDGSKTILYDQGAIANIIDGKDPDTDWLRPHTLFIRDVINVPLSVFLSGAQAMAAHPAGRWQEGWDLQTHYDGVRDFLGQHCDVVRAVSIAPSQAPDNSYEFWLAQDRNYLPVRVVAYTFRFSNEVPIGEGVINEMRELKRGVWFPFDATDTAYDPAVLQATGKQELQWRKRYTAEAASLEPAYDLAYFRDIPLPDGTAVYEVENEAIKRSYRLGTPSTQASTTFFGSWLLPLINALVVVAAIAAVAMRRRRRRCATKTVTFS